MATVFINGEETLVIQDANGNDIFDVEDVNVRRFLRTEVEQQNEQIQAIREERDDKVILRDEISVELANLRASIADLNTELTTLRAQRDANVAYLRGKGDDV